MPVVQIGPMSVDVPPDWTLSTMIFAGPLEDKSQTPAILTAKGQKAFQQNFVVTAERVAANETPEGYVMKQLDGLRKATIDRREARAPEKVRLVSGLEGLLTEQVVVNPGGEWVRQMQLVTIKEGVAYTLITSHLDGEPFNRARECFRGILLSLR